MSDRDILKRRQELSLASDADVRVKKLIFRNMFIKDADAEIARVLWNYFNAVSTRWPMAWNEKREGFILNRTTGFRALMRFLPLAYLTSGPIGSVVPEETFRLIFDKVKLTDEEFTSDKFKPGSSGQGSLFGLLCQQTHLDDSSIWQKKPST